MMTGTVPQKITGSDTRMILEAAPVSSVTMVVSMNVAGCGREPGLAGRGCGWCAGSNKLTAVERASVLATLHHESFMDKSGAQVWATLLWI